MSFFSMSSNSIASNMFTQPTSFIGLSAAATWHMIICLLRRSSSLTAIWSPTSSAIFISASLRSSSTSFRLHQPLRRRPHYEVELLLLHVGVPVLHVREADPHLPVAPLGPQLRVHEHLLDYLVGLVQLPHLRDLRPLLHLVLGRDPLILVGQLAVPRVRDDEPLDLHHPPARLVVHHYLLRPEPLGLVVHVPHDLLRAHRVDELPVHHLLLHYAPEVREHPRVLVYHREAWRDEYREAVERPECHEDVVHRLVDHRLPLPRVDEDAGLVYDQDLPPDALLFHELHCAHEVVGGEDYLLHTLDAGAVVLVQYLAHPYRGVALAHAPLHKCVACYGHYQAHAEPEEIEAEQVLHRVVRAVYHQHVIKLIYCAT